MELPELRKNIDNIDAKIALLLSERTKLVKKIGQEKNKLGLAIVDRNREKAVLQNIRIALSNEGLDQKETQAILSIYEKIMQEAAQLE